MSATEADIKIPWFGAKKVALELHAKLGALQTEHQLLKTKAAELGMLSVVQLQQEKQTLQNELSELASKIDRARQLARDELAVAEGAAKVCSPADRRD